MELAELNWRICADYLDDAIEALANAREQFEKALQNNWELSEILGEGEE